MKKMLFGSLWVVHIAAVAVSGGVLAAQERDFFFYERAEAELLKHKPTFEGSETVVTFSTSGPGPVQIQFPSRMVEKCAISVQILEKGQVSVLDQLLAITDRNPKISEAGAAAQVRLRREVRDIPCETALATLLRRGSQLSIALEGQRPRRISIDVPTYKVQVAGGSDMNLSAAFAGTSDHPVARWLVEVRRAVTRFVERGLRQP